jgi:chloramphenicol 3-O phosphotransferase
MIIILNGCSSAGKTSIIKEMQNFYDTPLFHMGLDRFWAMVPAQYKEYGIKAYEGYSFSKTYDSNHNPIIHIQGGSLATQIDYTMPQVIRTLADCGHDMAIDEIFINEKILYNYAKTLENHTVYLVGILCSLEELERREKQRGNRSLGLARGQIDLVHASKKYYDLTIDTTNLDVATCVQKIIHFIQQTRQPLGFKKLRKANMGGSKIA